MSFSGSKKTTTNHFDRVRSPPPSSPSGPTTNASSVINRSHESVFNNSASEKSLFFKKSFLRKNSDKKMKTTPDSSPKSTLTKQSRRRSKSEISLNEFLNNLQNNEENEKTEDLLAKALKVALRGKDDVDDIAEITTETKKTDQIEDSEVTEGLKPLSQRSTSPQSNMMMSQPPHGVVTDSDGLILPKKLMNPCLESKDRKDLHRELMFNNKVGKSVLNQKSELQRALEKQKERQLVQKQQEEDHKLTELGLKGELNRVIMERAQKLEKKCAPSAQEAEIDRLNPEYLSARAKLRTRIDTN